MSGRLCNQPTPTGPCQRVDGGRGCGVTHRGASPVPATTTTAPAGPPAMRPPSYMNSWERAVWRAQRKLQDELNTDAAGDDAALKVAMRFYEADTDHKAGALARAAWRLQRSGDGIGVTADGRAAAIAGHGLAVRGMDDDLDKLFNPESKRGNHVAGWSVTPDRFAHGQRSAHAVFTEYDAHHCGRPCTVTAHLDDGTAYDVFVDTDGSGLRWADPTARPEPARPARTRFGRRRPPPDPDATNSDALWADERNQDHEDWYSSADRDR